jgi:ectoine hydroxylase-related dioxygenase (phytanoyl-CoA dioxygenase family)
MHIQSTHPESALLDEPYDLTAKEIAFYREHGFVKLKNVLTAAVLAYFDELITDMVMEFKKDKGPMDSRDTYGKAFIQVANLWTRSDAIRALVFNRRLGRIASELMGVDGVRLYHDQALFKEPGGGFTPWHADQYYWPLASPHCTTVWIPLQATPLEMGPLEFSAGSHRMTEGRNLQIGDESERQIDVLLSGGGYNHVVEPFDLGEVSFHAGWLFHRAGPNRTDRPRKVMTTIYMDRNMRLAKPTNPHQPIDAKAWCPGVEAGQLISSPLNPVIYEFGEQTPQESW